MSLAIQQSDEIEYFDNMEIFASSDLQYINKSIISFLRNDNEMQVYTNQSRTSERVGCALLVARENIEKLFKLISIRAPE